MVNCIECGMRILIIGIEAHGFINCPECKTKQYFMRELGRSYRESQIEIDHEKQIINIKKEVNFE